MKETDMEYTNEKEATDRAEEAILAAIADQFIDEVNEEFSQYLTEDHPDLASMVNTLLGFFLDVIEKNENFLNISTSSGTVISLYVKQRLENTAIEALIGLLQQSPQKLRLKYPEYTARILVRGLADLYLEGVTDPGISPPTSCMMRPGRWGRISAKTIMPTIP